MTSQRTRSEPIKSFDLPRVDISEDKSPEKRNLALENGDCQLSTKEKVHEEAKKTRRTFLDNMDAIACGVEARFEENTGFSRRVTAATVDTARALGIPEAEIRRWTARRLIYDTEKVCVIRTLLQRLRGSPLDQADNKRHPRRTITSDPT